ncbi:hypothetical protein MHK_009148 [Candidatus Magnetomorum sp. HK-1]|nr:hypothetical protein MHK_009148 [Candidatus Magnetomorum sp. HK-1]
MSYNLRVCKLSILLIFTIFYCGCSKQWIISKGINFAVPVVLENGLESFLEESDPVIAEISVASNLKLLDIMLVSTPNNKTILNYAAFAYGAYALSFVEYKMEKAGFNEDEELENFHRQRARNLYLRSRSYGFRSLQLSQEGKKLVKLVTSEKIDLDKISAQLELITFDQRKALFWTTISWGSYLQISRDNLSELALVPVFKAMGKRVIALDKEHFFGMPLMIEAMLYAMSPMFGGDELKSSQNFKKVSDINKGMCLLNQVFKARFFCTQFDYPEEGVAILKNIVNTDTSAWPPKYNLINVIAKRKAKLYLKYADDIF